MALCGTVAEGAGMPDPVKWAAAVGAGDGVFPATIALLAEKDGKTTSLDVSADAVEARTYLSVIDPDSVNLFLKMNSEQALKKGAAAMPVADLLLVATPKNITLSRRDGKGVLQPLAEAASSGGKNTPAFINKFLFNAMHYNAVALAQQDDFVLAMIPASEGKPGVVQGLVLKDSRAAFTLQDKMAGDGLLQLVKAKGRFGVFKILVAPEGGPIAHGAKILLEGAP